MVQSYPKLPKTEKPEKQEKATSPIELEVNPDPLGIEEAKKILDETAENDKAIDDKPVNVKKMKTVSPPSVSLRDLYPIDSMQQRYLDTHQLKVAPAVLMYNRYDLADMMYQQLGAGMILVDGGSTKVGSYPPCQIIQKPENGYFTGNWNFAMKELSAQGFNWVWMLNDDVQGVSLKMLFDLLAAAQSLPGPTFAISPAYNSPHSHMHSRGVGEIRSVRWLDWAAALVNVEAWNKLGGFDERFPSYGADLDIARSAREAGYKMWVVDYCTVHHMGSQTVISEETAWIMNDVEKMNALLKEKWGVSDWSQMG